MGVQAPPPPLLSPLTKAAHYGAPHESDEDAAARVPVSAQRCPLGTPCTGFII